MGDTASIEAPVFDRQDSVSSRTGRWPFNDNGCNDNCNYNYNW